MSERPYITCRELIEFLHLYVSGELARHRIEEFERHLAVCPSCVNYLRSYRDTITLGKAAFTDPDQPAEKCAPEELENAVKIRLHRARQALRTLLDPTFRPAFAS